VRKVEKTAVAMVDVTAVMWEFERVVWMVVEMVGGMAAMLGFEWVVPMVVEMECEKAAEKVVGKVVLMAA
jgi:hypothetical protein